MTQKMLVEEIQRLYKAECLDKERVLAKSWVKRAIVRKHTAKLTGRDRPFALLCVNAHVEDTVERVARTFRPPLKPDLQLRFVGFPALQYAYTFEREGESVLVATQLMTVTELQAKAKEHRDQGDGHLAHADELDRFAEDLESRRGGA